MIMKKIISITLVLAMMLAMMPLAVFAEVGTDGFVYTLSDDRTHYIVSKYNGSAAEVEIPSKFNRITVAEIGESAFSDNTRLITLTIPDTVTAIGDSAFSGCSQLTDVRLSKNLTSIERYAFSDCTSLSSVELPDSLVRIGARTFHGCTNLSKIVLHDSLVEIGYMAFAGCESLEYNMYKNCRYLGTENNPYHAIISPVSKDLGSYTIHENTKTLAGGVFQDCVNLKTVTIPDSVSFIGTDAFEYCSELREVNLNDSLKVIGDYAFSACCGLLEINIPDSVTQIGKFAFWMCERITSVEIPDSVRYVGFSAFSCGNMREVYCEAESEPAEWDEYWDNGLSDATIYWGCKIEDESPAPAPVPDIILGDIDGDENVTAADYVFAKRAVMGTYKMTEAQKIAADIDKSGEVTAADYVFVKRAVMGTYTIKG